MTGAVKRKAMACYSRFFIIFPLIFVFLVFANDKQYEKANELNHTETTNKTEKELEGDRAPGVVAAEKSLVEVTDAIEEEEDDALAYTPAIAPATPQVLTASPSIQADIDLLRSKIVENNPKTEDISIISTNQRSELNKIDVSKALIVGADDTEVTEKSVSSLMIIPSEFIDLTSTSATTSTLTPTSSSIVKDEMNVDNNDKLVEMNEKENGGKLTLDINKHEQSNPTVAGTDANSVSLDEQQQLSTDDDKPSAGAKIIDTTEKDSHSENTKREITTIASESVNASDVFNSNGGGIVIDKEPEPIKLPDLSMKEFKDESTAEKVETSIKPDGATNDISPEISPPDVDVSSETKNEEVKKDEDSKIPPPVDESEIPSSINVIDINKITIPEDDANAVDKKMLSFAEWKKRLDKEKVEEEVVDAKSPVPKNKTQKERNKEKIKHMIRKNFASIDCGGKVVSANDEASNILSVLKDDKDAYMLNPCNVKAWFVVELCDRIQIDSIDFANFEMFSSTPETFNVYVTSRYPSGSWEKVGTFHAGPEKEIQTFTFEEKFYGRYIKIEIKKYHGNEHYCPLSLLRVFGITEVEQFEDSEADSSSEESHEDQEHVTPEQDTDVNPANIFQAAKNVVADLVNGMAKKLSGKTNSELNESGITSQGDLAKSVVVTVTALANDPTPDDQGLTYYHNDSLVIGETFVDWEMWYYYRLPKKMCPRTDYKRLIKKIKATVYFNNTKTNTQPLASVLIEPILKVTSPNIMATPLMSAISKSISENNVSGSVSRSELTPSEVQKATQTITKTDAAEIPTATPFLSVIPVEKPTVKLVLMTTVVTSGVSGISNTPLNESISTQSSDTNTIYNEDTVDVLEFKVNETIRGAAVAEKIVHNTSTIVTGNQTIADDNDDASNKSDVNQAIENLKVEPLGSVTSPEDKFPETIVTAMQKSSTTDMIQAAKSSTEIDKPSATTPEATDTANTVEITSTPSTKTPDKKSDVPSDHSAEKDTQSSAKMTSGSKESIIAKLNAKVKALQANLTLSMMYLDEMSEQYRTAVDKVDNRHKKKTAALNVSIQQQQLVINHQTMLIANLTKQVNLLAFQLQNLTQTTQEQHQKIIETHATWVFLEITIILLFLLLCRGRSRSHNDDIDDDRELNRGNRRFSEPVMMPSKEILPIEKPLVRKQLSDPSGIADTVYNSNQPLSPGLSKRRKRRKGPKTNVSEAGLNKGNDGDLPGSTGKAGLIFGRGLFTGLAGAFTRKRDSSPKLSRQADALLDEVTEKVCAASPLRKARSSELPTIDEDKTADNSLVPRPKSCSYLNDSDGFKKYNKDRAAGRFG